MKQLFDGVFMLDGEVGGRPLQLMYLQGETASILLDAGCAADPDRFIVPQIQAAGGDPAQLTWIINTHCDLDHTGGNHLMKQRAPGAILACGDADREACSGPQSLFRLRYDAYRAGHGLFYDKDTAQWILDQSGQPQTIECTFVGGEHIRLGPDWEVEIMALPGHSHGHLGILDPKHRALYGGDAIHGSVYLGFDGQPKLPPTYLHVEDYLSTIRLVEHLPITTYAGCHWPLKRGNEIAAFCAESRNFVHQADQYLTILLSPRSGQSRPRTLREICLELGPLLGDWPHGGAVDLELVYALNGHVERLVRRGLARAVPAPDDPRIAAFVLV